MRKNTKAVVGTVERRAGLEWVVVDGAVKVCWDDSAIPGIVVVDINGDTMTIGERDAREWIRRNRLWKEFYARDPGCALIFGHAVVDGVRRLLRGA
ncbi:MAG: hypothetical protein HYZ53_20950 [Planctomycetes bacterium]|nr:hypothetical protein [Planctomycetota bacterium]